MSGTTSRDPDPAPETVMIGLQWNGALGQKSEVLFEVETLFDPQRKEIADRLEAEANSDEAQTGEPTDEPTAATTTTMLTASEEESDGGGFPGVILVAVGALALAGVAVPLLIRRSRRAEGSLGLRNRHRPLKHTLKRPSTRAHREAEATAPHPGVPPLTR